MSGWKMSDERVGEVWESVDGPDLIPLVESIVNEALAEQREAIARDIEAVMPSPGDAYAAGSKGWIRTALVNAARIARGESA